MLILHNHWQSCIDQYRWRKSIVAQNRVSPGPVGAPLASWPRSAAANGMPGKLISPRRRHVVWRMHNRGASHATINTFLKYQFGASQSVSSGSITNICAAGRQHGDPRHRAPRTTARSLNAGHAAVLGGALDADASALTEELQDALSAAEPPGGRTPMSHPMARGQRPCCGGRAGPHTQ